MAIPSTGTTWNGAGFNAKDSRFLERGKLRQVLARDARGLATNISPQNSDGSLNWSPFATDGNWRGDLLAWELENGVWAQVEESNEGWHQFGADKDGSGANSKPTIKNDHFMILQSNVPFSSDLIEQGEPFSFMPVETARPMVRRLRNNMRLNDPTTGLSVVENPGAPFSSTFGGWGIAIDGDNIDRQFLLVSQFTRNGLAFYTVDGYALGVLDNIGPSKKDKKDSEGAELTYLPLPDGIFSGVIDGEYVPILKWTWQGGPGWAAMYASPVMQFTVTLGTQTSGTFTLTWGGNTTGAITAGTSLPTAATVKAALVALDDGYSASNWTVTGSAGGPFTVTTPVSSPLTGSGASLGTPGTFLIAPVP